jgi:hypothetical protein
MLWHDSIEELSKTVKALTGHGVGTMSRAEYQNLRGHAEHARLASENARLLLEIHRNEHGC